MLVTGLGSAAGRSIATQLSARGLPVLGADSCQVPGIAGTEAVVLPPASDPDWVPALRRLVDARNLNVVIPTRTEELPHLAAARAAFSDGVRLIVSDPGPVALANDRLLTAWTLQAEGIAVPRFGVPSDFAAAPASLAAMGGSVVVRPRVPRGENGAVVLPGAGPVDWAQQPEGRIVQEFIPGAGYVALVFGTRTQNAMAPHVVVVDQPVRAGLGAGTDTGAASAVGRRVATGAAADVAPLAMAAVHAVGLTGPVEVDIRRRADGTPVVLGLRARFGASSAAAPELLDAVLAAFLLPSFNPASFRRRPSAYAGAVRSA
ncbi:hypothetical protein D7003_08735 [Arthrobacter oryzae]|uniref:ATP-grasp domain-containing protein n=1 Tax=Arthrobacter oryzae TaxID=409290 RepID=A0A3N0C213_9MICC|nr:hypothetical protein D7003_08735 [Arthrobacter oryzae]